MRLSRAGSKEHRLTVAKRWGIETCIRFSPRQSGELPSPAVLSRAVSAIVGASWLDSGKDINVVTRVIERLGLVMTFLCSSAPLTFLFTTRVAPQDQPCIDPTILLLEPNNPHRADTVRQQTSSDDNQAANLFTKYVRSTEETPDTAVLLFDNDHCAEQRPRTTPPMEQAEALSNHTTQFGLLDYVDETHFGGTQDIMSSLGVASSTHTQSQGSSNTLQEGQAVDSQHREYGLMSPLDLGKSRMDHPTADTEHFQLSAGTFDTSEHRLNNTHIGQQNVYGRPMDSPVLTSGSVNMTNISTGQTDNEGEGLSLRTRTALVTPTSSTKKPAKRRKTSNRQESSGKDNSSQELVKPHPNETLLEQLIAHERRKFENQGRQDSFIFSLTQESISGLGAERHSWTLRVFFFAVASSHSMLTLRDILRACRDRTTGDLSEPMQGLSTAKRLEFIEHLEGNLAYFSLLRRCHILKLFMDNFDPSRQAEGGFIVQTQESISNTGRKKSGNPSHVAHSEMTKSMIQEIYPELQPNTPGYQTKYRSVSELRKLGKRLHFLTTMFGYGILGLLPSTTGSDLCISDSMYVLLVAFLNPESNLN